MKSLKLLLASIFLYLCMTTSAFSITLTIGDTTTDVGNLDDLIASAPKAGSEDAETAWVIEKIVPLTITYIDKQEDLSYFLTDTEGVYAVELPNSEPPVSESALDYFIIKNSTTMVLYANNVKYLWGVFDTTTDDFPSNDLKIPSDTLEISHVTVFYDPTGGGGGGGGGGEVPEPATMMLFGFGLLGVAGVSRKRMS